MAAPVVESFSGPTYEADSDNTLTLSRPTGVVAGDLLVALLFHDDLDTNTWSGPSGWSEIVTIVDSGDVCALSVWAKEAGDSEPSTYDFTKGSANGSVMGGGILRISGADTASPVDVSSNQDLGSVTDIVCPSVTTTGDERLILRFFVQDDNQYAHVAYPSGHTGLWAGTSALGDDISSGAAHIEQATAGATGTGTFDSDPFFARRAVGSTVAIRPAAGGGGDPVTGPGGGHHIECGIGDTGNARVPQTLHTIEFGISANDEHEPLRLAA